MTDDLQPLIPHIIIEPAHEANYSIIWLHGLGADGQDFVSLAEELHLPPQMSVRFIFPHAPVIPVTINRGLKMRAWYDIRSLTSDRSTDKAGIMQSVTAITALIEQEKSKKIDAKNIIVGGFSQGAAMA